MEIRGEEADRYQDDCQCSEGKSPLGCGIQRLDAGVAYLRLPSWQELSAHLVWQLTIEPGRCHKEGKALRILLLG